MAALTGAAAGHDAERDAERAIDWTQVRHVLWARWRLALRSASTAWWKLALTVLVWTGFSAAAFGSAVGCFFVVATLRANPDFAHVVRPAIHVAFLFVLVSLSVSPALGLRGNEFLDVTKLFVYPVNHRTVFAASLAGLLTSPSVLFFTFPLLGAVAGYGGSVPEVALGLVVVLLLVLVAVAVGQTGLLLFLDLFRSRRWQDVSRIVVALVGAGAYGVFRVASGSAFRTGGGAALDAVDQWRNWSVPLPSWWAAHAITGTGAVRWLPALALPLLLFWLIVAAARLQERAYFGEIEERRDVSASSGRGVAAWFGRRFRGAFGAVLEKDLRVLLRDPTIRILVIQQTAFALVPLAATFFGRGAGDATRSAVRAEFFYAGIVALPVFASLGFTMNPYGTEGPGLQHALLTAVPRRTLALGKMVSLALTMGLGLSLLTAAGAGVLAWFVQREGALGTAGRVACAGLESMFAFFVFAAVGAVIGAYAPSRIVSRDRRALRQTSGGREGCMRGLLGLAAFMIGSAACVPIAFAFHHPAIFEALGRDSRPFLAPSIALAAAYVAGAVVLGSRMGGAALERREEEVLAVLARSDQ